ncbi:hypothetical protein GX48_02991 [Paracoccidioides brasiliensis]|nr:hypothetical protein GX48_02991 [Paracoccidioides brasiliensis]
MKEIMSHFHRYRKATVQKSSLQVTGDVDIDIKLVSDWDLASVAVRPDPTLSKLGLATQCISRLEQDLLERLARAEKEK